jgi:peptidoglycan/LPS O-acetylase OafA/YrhL
MRAQFAPAERTWARAERTSRLAEGLRALFVRPPTRLAPLDGLRALAILWTMAFHSFFIAGFRPSARPGETAAFLVDPLNRLVLRADLGVDIFFVISGFLIGGLLMDEWAKKGTIAFGRFQLRRALRIVPAYATTLALCLVLSRGLDVERLWTNLLFVNNYVSIDRELMPHSWSLAVEGQFYVAFPLLLLLVWRHERLRLPLLLGLLGAAIAVRAVVVARMGLSLPVSVHPRLDAAGYVRYVDGAYQRTYMRFGDLVCGAIAAHAARRGAAAFLERRPALARAGLALAAALVAAVIAVPPFRASGPWTSWPGTLYLALFPYVFAAAAAYFILVVVAAPSVAPPLTRFLSARALFPVSQLSYSMYLLHPLIMFGAYFTVLDVAAVPRLAAYLGFVAVSLVVGALVFLAVERPFQRLRPPRAAA